MMGGSYFHDIYLEGSFLHGEPNYENMPVSVYLGEDAYGDVDSTRENVYTAKWF